MSSTRRSYIGPGLIVTAAFIGPGTVTTCTLAGAEYGYALLWALVFACIATYILQEMSGRLGLVGRTGLGEALYSEMPTGWLRAAAAVMVVSAIGIGNAAYQTGNILGAAMGLSSLSGLDIRVWSPIIGGCAFVLLWFGSYKSLERIFGGLVFVMSLCFIVTAFMTRPDIGRLFSGMFVPRVSGDNIYLALGLVGTTIVPYNLFLYASVIQEKWRGTEELPLARHNLLFAVIVGGIISMAVVTTAAAAFFGTGAEIRSAGDMAIQLEPLLGGWARAAIAVGLFGAGMTSAMTAPLAAAYAVSGAFRWNVSLKSGRFRGVWAAVLLTGVVFSSIGLQPVPAIIFAQAANGLLLPVVAVFLLIIVNSRKLLGASVNSRTANVFGALIIVIAFLLGIRGLARLF